MKVYPGAKMLKSFSPKENDLFSRFGRARHHGKCSRQGDGSAQNEENIVR
jgi:hypothetical protein